MPRIGNVIAMTPDQFQRWLHHDDKTKIAAANHGNAENGVARPIEDGRVMALGAGEPVPGARAENPK
jgi:hypothetical protein